MSTPDTNLYSGTQPAAISSKIRRIMPQSGSTHYATASFRSDDEGGTTIYLEAKEQDNKLWMIRKITEKPAALYGESATGADETLEKITPLKHDLCFFDALHYTAHWELDCQNPDTGAMIKISENGRAETLPHWREIAAAERQPIDRETGLPAPAAGGDILAEDGTFSRKDRDAALATTDNLAGDDALPVPGRHESGRNMLVPLPVSTGRELTGGSTLQNASKLKTVYNRNVKKYKNLYESFNIVTREKGGHICTGLDDSCDRITINALGGGVLLAGLAFPIALLSIPVATILLASGASSALVGTAFGIVQIASKPNPGRFVTDTLVLPHRRFNRHLKAMRKNACRFEQDSPQRQAGLWIADQYEQAYHTLSVHYAFNKASEGGVLARATLNRRIKTLEKAYQRQGFAPEEITELKTAIQTGQCGQDKYTSFEHAVIKQMHDKTDEYKKAMNSYQEHDLKKLSGPR